MAITNPQVIDGAIYGGGDSRSVPATGSALYLEEGMDAVEAGAPFEALIKPTSLGAPAAADPSVPQALSTPMLANEGILTDYYGRIFVIPKIIDLRNPPLGQPQPYSIWNAYFSSNTLSSIVPVNDTGLVNSASAPDVFNELQLKDYSITVTAAAPIQSEAAFTFNFTNGSDTLYFRIQRALLVTVRPDRPIKHDIRYKTDIHRARKGNEQRFSVYPFPRQEFTYDITYLSDAELRKVRDDMFTGLPAPVVLPLWFEPFRITTEALASQADIYGDFLYRDFGVDAFVYVMRRDETAGELAEVQTITDSQITLKNVLNNTYPAGSYVYPASFVQQHDMSGFDRYPVNAGRRTLSGFQTAMTALGGKEASVTMYNSMLLLDVRPLANENPGEDFFSNLDIIDFGAATETNSYQDYARITGQRQYLARTRADWQYWKLVLDTLVGSREPFYHSTYRDDLVLASQPSQGGTELVVTDEPNYATRWFNSPAHKHLRLLTTAGDSYHEVTSATDNLDGTISLTLNPPLTDDPDWSTILQISFLEQVRLGSDIVTVYHFLPHRIISLAIRTTEE